MIAATEDNDTNIRVFEDAEQRQMLCNVVDVTHLCNFILPRSAARRYRNRRFDGRREPGPRKEDPPLLSGLYGDEYAVARGVLGSLREELKHVIRIRGTAR